MKKSELKQLIKEVISEDIFLQNKKSPEEKAKRLDQELDLEYKVKFGVEVYEGDIILTKQTLPYFKKYSKIKKVTRDLIWHAELTLKSLLEVPIPKEVEGNFSCSFINLTTLEGASEKVGESFYCNDNNLTILEGAPEKVGENFICSHNNLTTLEGAPKEVGGYFNCAHNYLTTLKGAPEKVAGDFWCAKNKLTSLKGAPKYVGGSFYCSYNNVKFTKEDVRKVCDVKGKIYT